MKVKITDIYPNWNFKAAKGHWTKYKIDFYTECKTKFNLTDAEIASIMDIPEESVKEFSKMVVLKEEKHV